MKSKRLMKLIVITTYTQNLNFFYSLHYR